MATKKKAQSGEPDKAQQAGANRALSALMLHLNQYGGKVQASRRAYWLASNLLHAGTEELKHELGFAPHGMAGPNDRTLLESAWKALHGLVTGSDAELREQLDAFCRATAAQVKNDGRPLNDASENALSLFGQVAPQTVVEKATQNIASIREYVEALATPKRGIRIEDAFKKLNSAMEWPAIEYKVFMTTRRVKHSRKRKA